MNLEDKINKLLAYARELKFKIEDVSVQLDIIVGFTLGG